MIIDIETHNLLVQWYSCERTILNRCRKISKNERFRRIVSRCRKVSKNELFRKIVNRCRNFSKFELFLLSLGTFRSLRLIFPKFVLDAIRIGNRCRKILESETFLRTLKRCQKFGV